MVVSAEHDQQSLYILYETGLTLCEIYGRVKPLRRVEQSWVVWNNRDTTVQKCGSFDVRRQFTWDLVRQYRPYQLKTQVAKNFTVDIFALRAVLLELEVSGSGLFVHVKWTVCQCFPSRMYLDHPGPIRAVVYGFCLGLSPSLGLGGSTSISD